MKKLNLKTHVGLSLSSFSRFDVWSWLAAMSLVIPVVMVSLVSHAANVPYTVKPGRISMPFHSGSVSGGQAGPDFSLLGIKQVASSGGGTELILSYGDHTGHPFRGEPGYFHVAVDRSGKRISLDLAQVSRTAIDQKDLTRILGRAQLFGTSDITTDPHDGSTNITLNLKRAVNVKVRSTGGDEAKLILDLQPFESASNLELE